jgi:hypothetical protein
MAPSLASEPRSKTSVQMPPNQESLTAFNGQANHGPNGQQDLCRHVPERQTLQHRNIDLALQPIDNRLEFETFVVCRGFVAGELAKNQGFLLSQNSGVQQLREHALNAPGVFGDVFDEQNAVANLGEIRRAHQ